MSKRRLRQVLDAVPPPRYRKDPCPTCGHDRQIVNGAWLKHQRLAARLTQREFGDTFIPKLSSPYLSDLESNRRECPANIEAAYATLESA